MQEWQEIYSPCFWTSTSVLIQLVFITSIVAQFLFKRIRWCRQRLKTATPFVLGEGIQVLSWIILSLAVFSLRKTKSAKHPLIIRAWLVLSFLQSIISLIFDLRFTLSDHGYMGFAELMDLFTLVICTYLFAISVRGKTGITLINSSITEPLLSPSAGQQTETKRTSLYGKASVLDLVTFSWMTPLFVIGYKKPLDKNDVPDIDERDYADLLSDSFKRILADVEHRHGLSTLSIYRAMFLFIRRKAILNAVFAILCACASYVGPSLINDLVKFLGGERKNGLQKGYLLAVAFLSAKVVETIAERQWIFGAQRLGMRLRAALISHIYQKGLRLSCGARQKHSSGEIINYMSVDIQRITEVMWYTNYIWMLPIQLSLAVYVLHLNLGAGAWAGLAATLAIMTCNIPLTRLQKRLQSEIMAAKDNRMKATTEVLRSMKILKLQAWDTEYLQKLEALRREEHNWLWKSVRLSALTTFIFWGSPAFISSITFGTCILMGIPLTAGTVLSALATFRMLQDPIFTLPDLLSVFAQGKVSADRVAQYLTAVHGGALAPIIVAAQSFFQIFQVAGNYWMAWACPPTSATTPRVGLGLIFFVYIVLSIGSALCVFGRSMLVSLVGLLTAEKFFKNMLHCILRAPMAFFDSTPTGRILNRVGVRLLLTSFCTG
uniref:ABC transmembrane type-1 domain-containing protein n=1 Tax=Aegilops tauschii subsp. strangulata TaxID=200361 RepID=A0A453CX89_AEGTS